MDIQSVKIQVMRHIFFLKIFLVFSVLSVVSFVYTTTYADSSSIFFSSGVRQVQEGERITVDVKVQSVSEPINAISGSVSFPSALLDVVSITKERSIISLWTREPQVLRDKIPFEGVALNPGFQGSNGVVFHINFRAKHTGTAVLNFTEGALLANDGQGTNVLAKLNSLSFKILPATFVLDTTNKSPDSNEIRPTKNTKISALPVIIDYSPAVAAKDGFYIKGKGAPNALTKIVFKDTSFKSLGEQLIELVQTKTTKLDDVLVNNDAKGNFQYVSSKNLVAGVYNATPFLVDEDTNTEKPGFGVQLLVSDSKIVKALVVVLNVLGLLIPIVALGVIVYFIPWYSFKRMRVIKKRLVLEEDKLDLSEHQLHRQDKILDHETDHIISKS